jgi:hypothetical protein
MIQSQLLKKRGTGWNVFKKVNLWPEIRLQLKLSSGAGCEK